MISSPRKNIGIHHSGKVFHYSNTKDQVVVDLTIAYFHNKFKRQYGASDVSLFYGVPPCA